MFSQIIVEWKGKISSFSIEWTCLRRFHVLAFINGSQIESPGKNYQYITIYYANTSAYLEKPLQLYIPDWNLQRKTCNQPEVNFGYPINYIFKWPAWLSVCLYFHPSLYSRSSPSVFDISFWNFAHVPFSSSICLFVRTVNIELL